MDEVRERLAKTYYDLRWVDDSWGRIAPQHRAPYYELIDAILAEIRTTHVIWSKDRAMSLREAVVQAGYEEDGPPPDFAPVWSVLGYEMPMAYIGPVEEGE